MKNTQGKTRPHDDPYEIWTSFDGSWTWRVRKKYQAPDAEAKNPYARWFCDVSSPFSSRDSGDVYIKEIKSCAVKTGGRE
jgi:hypothetical protein